MNSSSTSSLIQRFAGTIMGLVRLVGDRYTRDRSVLAAVMLGQQRLQCLAGRFTSLLARIEAGTIRTRQPGRAARETKPRPGATPDAPRPPRGFGWLVRDNGPEGWRVRGAAAQIGSLLNEAETLALLAKAPRQAGRIVRPLCNMLRLEVPELLRQPPRPTRERRVRQAAAKVLPRELPPRLRRVASASWPKGVVDPGETVPLRPRRRRRGG